MEEAYRKSNQAALSSGRSRGHFIVDLAKPGHMTACLSTFQSKIGASIDNWDAAFSESWKTADLVDCILSYAATEIVKKVGTLMFICWHDDKSDVWPCNLCTFP